MQSAQRLKGLTLIELLIAAAMVAILASVALPYYYDQVSRAQIRAAQSDLVALGLNMENYFQRALKYPQLTDSVYTPATGNTAATWSGTGTTGWAPAWAPAAKAGLFVYSVESSTSTSYTLKAVGSFKTLSGDYSCVLKLYNTNARTAEGCPAGVTSW